MVKPLYEYAAEIRRDWKRVNYAAEPYLRAMGALNGIDDMYGYDSAKDVVTRFLVNAGTWRGETAKRVKAELRQLAGIKR